MVYLLAARNGIHETNAMFVFVTNLTSLRNNYWVKVLHILATVLVCPEVNKVTRLYKEYKISVTTKIPKNGQKQRSHSGRGSG